MVKVFRPIDGHFMPAFCPRHSANSQDSLSLLSFDLSENVAPQTSLHFHHWLLRLRGIDADQECAQGLVSLRTIAVIKHPTENPGPYAEKIGEIWVGVRLILYSVGRPFVHKVRVPNGREVSSIANKGFNPCCYNSLNPDRPVLWQEDDEWP